MQLGLPLTLASIGNPVSDRAWAIFLGGFIAALAVGLLILSWTRFGQSKLLTKCIAIALLAHIWLLLYAYGTRIPYGTAGNGQGVSGSTETAPTPSGPMMVAWTPTESFVEDPPSLSQNPAGEDPSSVDASAKKSALWNQSLQLPHDSLLDFKAPEPETPDLISDEHLLMLGQVEHEPPIDLPIDPTLNVPVSQEPVADPVADVVPEVPEPRIERPLRSLAEVPSIYRMRFSPDRLAIATQGGGDAQTEESVRRALAFLAKAQSPDGSWNAQTYGAGRLVDLSSAESRYRADTGKFADTAMTGLALLAFLGAGHTHKDPGAYSEVVQRGLLYLREQQFPSGDLSGRGQIGSQPTVRYSRMYSHGIAGIAIAEAYAMTNDIELLDPLRRATGYSLKAMNPHTGGWRYDFASDDPGDTSQFGWQAMLLSSANASNASPLHGSHRVLMQKFLDSVSTGKAGGLAVYRNLGQQSRPPEQQASSAMTAEAFALRVMLGLPMSAQAMQEANQMLLKQLPGRGEPNFYYWYYATMAMYQTRTQADAWEIWNEALKRELTSSQVVDGEFAGSWDPRCVWGGHGGRIYTTALACMCLEVYYRYLPLYQSDSYAP